MPDTVENPRAVIGGNKPPIVETLKEACDDLPQRLPEEFADLAKRTKELEAAFANVPEIITDDIAGDVSDAIAQITAHSKACEAMRTAAISPVLSAQRTINTWFDSNVFDSLDVPDKKRKPGKKQILLARMTAYEQEKVAQEKRRREEEERIAKEKAAAAERERVEAERKAREAREAEERRQQEEARRLREAEEAERQRVAAEERKAREAAEAEAKAIQNAKDLEEAIKREEEAKIARAKREDEARIAREKAEADAAERRREADARAAEERARTEAAAKSAREAADKAASEAAKAEEASRAKASAMHTTRGSYGSSSSLKTEWKGFLIDRETLDLEALRPFMSDDDLQKALNGFVKTNKGTRKIAGADIREVTAAVVRG